LHVSGQLHAGVGAHDAHAAVGLLQREAALRSDERAGDALHALAADLLDGDLAAEVARQQLRGAGEVELEALLDHARAPGVGERGESHRGRIDHRRHVLDAQRVVARLQREGALFAHHGITRDRRAFARIREAARVERARRGAGVDGERVLRPPEDRGGCGEGGGEAAELGHGIPFVEATSR